MTQDRSPSDETLALLYQHNKGDGFLTPRSQDQPHYDHNYSYIRHLESW